jgi:preprotein translocase subunit SecA
MAKAGLIKSGESLYDASNIMLMQHLSAALRAHAIYRRDVEYIVKDGEVIIVDEFTGRTMPGRRWSDGLHQAIEAKEGVKVRQENQTLASITFQNYFRMYKTLSGMTGTADTEAFEFLQIYGLEVVVIPTHQPMVRKDHADLVYLTRTDKFDAILDDIRDCQQRGQPVLVGTTSIETSELLSGVLAQGEAQARGAERQAARARGRDRRPGGRPGAITIATNMAGRGTDIVLGGSIVADLAAAGDDEARQAAVREEWQRRHQQVVDAGGLHIIGTERHESRRIDNQLRGRSGRQGDPGSSRFYLSMEDNLMRIFGEPEKTKALLARVGMKEGEVIESRLLSRQIERAQRKVEAHNFDIRKQLLKYDDVANDQRRVIYGQRTELMEAEEIGDSIAGIREEVINELVERFVPADSVEEQWDLAGLEKQLETDFGFSMELQEWVKSDENADPQTIAANVLAEADRHYEAKVATIGPQIMRHFEKAVMLQQLDVQWKEHLAAMDYLRQGIHLRGYAQKNPEQEYKREAFQMFSDMLDRVKHDVVSIVSRVQIRTEEEVEELERRRREAAAATLQLQHAEAQSATGGGEGPVAQPRAAAEPVETFVRSERKVGRNEPCPCGSGKKYKHCHGQLS